MDERVSGEGGGTLLAGCNLGEKGNPSQSGDFHPVADRVAARRAVYRVTGALPSVVSHSLLRVGRRRRSCTRSDAAEGPGLQKMSVIVPGLEKWCTVHARRGLDVGGDAREGPDPSFTHEKSFIAP